MDFRPTAPTLPFDRPADSSAPTKVVCFDAVRGLAAVMAMMSHVVLTFWPGLLFRSGPIWDQSPAWLQAICRFPLRFLLNGRIAVLVFFVLSGYVLSLAFFQTGSTAAVGSAARRRYLRLMLPVAAAVMLAYLLMTAGAMRNHAAIAEMNAAYGLPQTPADAKPGWSYSWLAQYYDFAPSLPNALAEATWGAFAHPCPYDWPLYTMPIELRGSFLVFGFLALFGAARNRWLLYAIVGGLLLTVGQEEMVDFIVGMAICDLVQRNRGGWNLSLPLLPAVAIVAVAIFAVSWGHIAAYLIVGAVAFSSPLQNVLSARWLTVLGETSFALYVIHMPILCSLGCGLYLAARNWLDWSHTPAALFAIVIFLPATFFASWVFHRVIDRPTMTLVRRLDDGLFKPTPYLPSEVCPASRAA